MENNHINTIAQHAIYVVHFQEGRYIHGNCVSIYIFRENTQFHCTLAAEIFWETPLSVGALLYRSLFFLLLTTNCSVDSLSHSIHVDCYSLLNEPASDYNS